MADVPAGWYPDQSGGMRWWDGSAWTDNIQPAAPAGPPRRRPVWPWILGAVGLVVIAGLVAAALLVVPLVQRLTAGPAATIAAFDQAWDDSDCALLEQSTTAAYRLSTLEDDEPAPWQCADFEDDAAQFNATVENYDITVESVSVSGATATVETRESFDDADGSYAQSATYHLVREGIDWRIDTIDWGSVETL